MDRDSKTKKQINAVVLHTLKLFRQNVNNKKVSFDRPFIKHQYNFNFDENFNLVAPAAIIQRTVNFFNALYKYTNEFSIIMDFEGQEGFFYFHSKDENFINIIKNRIKINEKFKFRDIVGFYPNELKTEFNLFKLENPYEQELITGNYLFHVSPLCINKQAKKAFFQIFTGFDTGNFNLNLIHPAQRDYALKQLIENFENRTDKNFPKENSLIIENLELNNENSQQATDFINSLNNPSRELA